MARIVSNGELTLTDDTAGGRCVRHRTLGNGGRRSARSGGRRGGGGCQPGNSRATGRTAGRHSGQFDCGRSGWLGGQIDADGFLFGLNLAGFFLRRDSPGRRRSEYFPGITLESRYVLSELCQTLKTIRAKSKSQFGRKQETRGHASDPVATAFPFATAPAPSRRALFARAGNVDGQGAALKFLVVNCSMALFASSEDANSMKANPRDLPVILSSIRLTDVTAPAWEK